MAKNKDVASVLAFEKKLVPSDGYLYGTTWENRTGEATPLKLIEKSVRGTVSHRLGKSEQADPTKLDAKVEEANPHRVDSCSLLPGTDTLKLEFSLKFLGNVETPSVCNKIEFAKTYAEAVRGYIREKGFRELSLRYACNLANARYLWRNRVGAEEIEVNIKFESSNTKFENVDHHKEWRFNAQDFDRTDFNTDSQDVTEISRLIAETLSSKQEAYLLFKICAFTKIGMAQEVYPSEELVLDKSNRKGKKSKILYHVNEIAALHSQKIGNALRTIDTWYPKYGEEQHDRPIPAEPYGSVTHMGKAFRHSSSKADFYTLFDRFARGEKLSSDEEEHFVMAVLLRGGIFGEKPTKDKK